MRRKPNNLPAFSSTIKKLTRCRDGTISNFPGLSQVLSLVCLFALFVLFGENEANKKAQQILKHPQTVNQGTSSIRTSQGISAKSNSHLRPSGFGKFWEAATTDRINFRALDRAGVLALVVSLLTAW